MNKNYMSANTVVRKISYNNDMDLHAAIEGNLIDGFTVFKLVQVIPIDEMTAYLVLTPDPDKMVAQFFQYKESDDENIVTEVFPEAPNGDLVIMSIAEIELLRKQDDIEICDEPYEILEVKMVLNERAERSLFVTVKNALDDIPEYPENEEK